MKKLFAPFALLAITGILFSSCSNSSKLAITKRHYRSGYYVDFGSKSPTTTPVPLSKLLVKHQAAPKVKAKPENHVSITVPVAVSEKPFIIEKIATLNKNIKENNLISANIIPLTQKVNTSINNDISGLAGDGHHDRNSVSVPFVVIVLCAIFIPPLGVGLMYGINSYFWIDLILTLLFF